MITSIRNPKVKAVRELLSTKKHRDATQRMIIEGVRLAEEVLAANAVIHTCLFSSQLTDRGATLLENVKGKKVLALEVSADLMDRISDTKTSQGILLVADYPKIQFKEIINTVFVLDKIQDPGNLGTILRTANAFEIDAVLLTDGTTDPFAPKALRAAMGAQFHLAMRRMDPGNIIEFCKKEHGLTIYNSESECPNTCWNIDLTKPTCILIGSEARGISADLRKAADGCVGIPMGNQTESFNAAVAAGILMYEINRQRKVR